MCDVVCAECLPAVSAHDLQHKRPLVAEKQRTCDMNVPGDPSTPDYRRELQTDLSLSWIDSPLSGRHDGIHHLDDPVQCRVGADGHVCATEVVVDGADHADNVELRVTAGGFLVDQTCKT